MVEYECKSAIIGKAGQKDENENYPVFVSLFDINEPHKTGEVPKEMLRFNNIHKIELKELKLVEYLLVGKDIVINNMKKIVIETDDMNHLIISGKQE